MHQHPVWERAKAIRVWHHFQTVSPDFRDCPPPHISHPVLNSIVSPSLSVLSMQEPADPEETFYILSLTEISGCDAGVAEPVPYLPATEASAQQQR